MTRYPSPELVRFLLKPEFESLTLGEVQAKLGSTDLTGFNPDEIARDLQYSIDKKGINTPVKGFAKPIALCLFDDGQQGKSTFVNLLKHYGINVYSTDILFEHSKSGEHEKDELREFAQPYNGNVINHYIKNLENDSLLVAQYAELFFEFCFKGGKPICVVEGFLHQRDPKVKTPALIEDAIIKGLRARGYKVWKANKIR